MRGKPTGILALVLSLCGYALAQDLSSYPKEKVQLFLLAGQSNMSGRGIVSDEDKKIHTRIFALSKDGEWVPAVDPIHYDKKGAGVGPAKSFALSLVEKDKNMVIGLIPAACGGSPISTWEPGAYHQQTRSHPYDDAIARTRRAMKDGVLRGILWHQGESDCTPGKAVEYEERLRRLILRFRADLDVPDVPFLIGQLGQFPDAPWNDAKKCVNEAHIKLADELPNVESISSDGLTSNSDNLHFNAES